jgi:hypothetical protein
MKSYKVVLSVLWDVEQLGIPALTSFKFKKWYAQTRKGNNT